jgi:hypothetical protein
MRATQWLEWNIHQGAGTIYKYFYNCDITSAYPHDIARLTNTALAENVCGTYTETDIFDVQLYIDGTFCFYVSTLHGMLLCGNFIGNSQLGYYEKAIPLSWGRMDPQTLITKHAINSMWASKVEADPREPAESSRGTMT